jgi:two-component system, sporulation sensor kinase E
MASVMAMRQEFLDKLIERLDRLDPGSLQSHFLHLSREKGLMETVFHALQEGVLVLDGRGRIRYANRSAEQMLGFSLEEDEGAPIQRYLRDVAWESILGLDEEEWSKLVNREIEITYPEHRFLAFYLVPLPGDSDDQGAVMLLRDVTRERETEQRTLESERFHAIHLLAAGVAHEIGNPLNSLTIHLQILERELRQPGQHGEDLVDLVRIAREEVFRLDQTIHQFLRAVRPVEPDLQPERLKQIVDETLEFLCHEIRDRNLLVEVEDPDGLPPISVDRNQIKQAVFNIVKNAMEAIQNGGLLKITLSETERFQVLSFQDDGPGIDPDHLGRLFEAYQTTKEHGSGLGLMIVQRIVRSHGGEIQIHSEPGRGATVTLFLPRDERRMRMLKAHRPAPGEPDGEPA